jgi:hypothetical protein
MGIFDIFKQKNEESGNGKVAIRTLEIPDFTQVDIGKLQHYYDWTLDYGERKLNVDLNYEIDSITQSDFKQVIEFVKEIPKYDIQNREYIQSDFEQNVSITSEYLNYYLEELAESELGAIIDLNNRKKSRDSLLLEQLKLIRVGIYPQASYFATFDYSIDMNGKPCNQLLVVNINHNGTLDYITWES